MTDRELLELAAKAAGIEVGSSPMMPNELLLCTDSDLRIWNPITDDGDALRLAVKLDIEIYTADDDGIATYAGYWTNAARRNFATEQHGNDPYAATRRAIVRAAAEIGKELP